MSAEETTRQQWRDPEVLRALYHDDGLTLAEVADEVGCTKPTVTKWMDKHGIERRDVGGAEKDAPYRDEALLRELYWEEGLNTNEIADKFGCSPRTVRYWMKKHGIEIKDRGHHAKQRPISIRIDSDGYPFTESKCNGEASRVCVHQLVLIAHGEDPHRVFAPDTHTHHKNDCKFDNRPSNLELLDVDEHTRLHAYETEFWKYSDNYEGEVDG